MKFKPGHILILILFLQACNSNKKEDYRGWKVAGGTKESTKYSALDQIDTNNVTKLQVAWTYLSEDGDTMRRGPMQCNPIIVDNIMYGVSPKLKLFAVDAATGKEKWYFDPTNPRENRSWVRSSVNMNRGVCYWQDGEDKRILYTVGSVAFAVNAVTPPSSMSASMP